MIGENGGENSNEKGVERMVCRLPCAKGAVDSGVGETAVADHGGSDGKSGMRRDGLFAKVIGAVRNWAKQ